VVPHRDTEDPREDDLVHDRREGDEEEARVDAAGRHGMGGGHRKLILVGCPGPAKKRRAAPPAGARSVGRLVAG
jgi:hypothetical protein